ncbi:MAG: sugar phosphate nucleotidyltransferase [Patescibacteria group bacterium]
MKKKVFILAGGQGKRLRPYTYVIPKPLMPLGEKPILTTVLERLARKGFNDITISLGYMGDMIVQVVKGLKISEKISFTRETSPLGTAGSLSLMKDFSDDVLVINGDLLTTLDFNKIYDFHKKNKATATIGIFPREVKIDFGIIETKNKIDFNSYSEKPTFKFDVSMGINVLSPKIKKYLKKNEYLDMPTLIKRLQENGEKIVCYKEKCKWLDIGREFDYKIATEEFEKNGKEYL